MKNERTWKRLTMDKLDVIGLDRLETYFEVEYLVIPNDNWVQMKNFDNKIRFNLSREQQKVVYRFRRADVENRSFLDYCIQNRNAMKNKSIFMAGFERGKAYGEAVTWEEEENLPLEF